MPKNNRQPATVTRSISWRFDLLAAIDTKVQELRTDRSTYINGVLEHVLGLYPHPELMGGNAPFRKDKAEEWAPLAAELEKEANRDRETKRVHKAAKSSAVAGQPGGLVKRPAPR
jgi:hypothetical protein